MSAFPTLPTRTQGYEKEDSFTSDIRQYALVLVLAKLKQPSYCYQKTAVTDMYPQSHDLH